MSGGYNAVETKGLKAYKVQTQSGGFQKPFHFGGSQVPVGLMLHPKSFSGAGISLVEHTNPTVSKRKLLTLPFIR